MPVSDLALKRAYQEAERLCIALHDCLLEEKGGPLAPGLRIALSTARGVCAELRELAAPPPPEPRPGDGEGIEGKAWAEGEHVVRFRIEAVPPRYKSVNAATRHEAARHWAGAVARLAAEAGIEPRFMWARITVTVAAPGRWDLDNRDLKPLLVGLTRAHVVEDDSSDHLELCLKGVRLGRGERGYTEVLIEGKDPQPPPDPAPRGKSPWEF